MSVPPVSVSKLILSAIPELKTEDVAPSVRDLEAYLSGPMGLKLGPKLVENTVKNMTRRKQLRIVRTRRVDYRNRPVAEYDHALDDAAGAGYVDLAAVISSAWR